ncbi:MAG: hypothetical protein V4641_05525 [Pseudomonadota bacterium]
MTPEDAKTRWCPFARAPVQGYDSSGDVSAITAANRCTSGGSPDPDTLCLASRCMAWRWNDTPSKLLGFDVASSGYCGLVPHPPTVEKTP